MMGVGREMEVRPNGKPLLPSTVGLAEHLCLIGPEELDHERLDI